MGCNTVLLRSLSPLLSHSCYQETDTFTQSTVLIHYIQPRFTYFHFPSVLLLISSVISSSLSLSLSLSLAVMYSSSSVSGRLPSKDSNDTNNNGKSETEKIQFDAMECELDGITSNERAHVERIDANVRADSDPEQIMLALRGLPIFPNLPTKADASETPEAAFIVGGGPTCLLREVLMAPYPHPDAPRQLYETIDAARRAQNTSEFKPALRALKLVLMVWKKKHVWKVLRENPHMTLQDGLDDEIRRSEERKLRAEYKEAERARKLEEERIFQQKMAEQESGEEAMSHQPSAASLADAPPQAESEYEDDDADDYDEEDEDEDHPRQRKRKPKTETQHQQEAAAQEISRHEQPDEVLEFPAVTPEEELEFLTFYYNVLGSIYQSAGASSTSSGSRIPGVQTDTVRWGRMRVIPCPADNVIIRAMLEGTKHGAVAATSITQPAYAANLETSILDEEEPEESEEDYIASTPTDLSNSSDARALIALWQAKRAHDLYVQLKDGEKNKLAQEQRDRDAAARGKSQQDIDDDDDVASNGGQSDGSSQSQNLHTTLGLPGFARINIPNLSLAQLQSESKALGLFGFPHITHLASGGGIGVGVDPRHAIGASLSSQEMESSHVFWSTQPIVRAAHVPHKLTESHKSLQINGGASSAQATAHNATPSTPQKLINPYAQCSSADAVTYSNLGTTLFHLGNYPLALRCFYVSLQIRLATLRPADDEYIDVATSLNNLGVVLSQLHFFATGWQYFSAARELALQRLDPVHPRLNLIQSNLSKIQPRRQGILAAPGLLQELRTMAETKERKEWEAREKRLAKAAKKGSKGGAKSGAPETSQPSARPSSRKTSRPGKKDEEKPKEFHEDPRFFQPVPEGQPPIVPPTVTVEGAPPPPLGTAAAAIKRMPLRQFDVEMGLMQKLSIEFGPAKKKAPAAGGKKKKSTKK